MIGLARLFSGSGSTGGGAPTGPAGGDLAGAYPNPTVKHVNVTNAVQAASFVTGGTELHAGDGPGFPAPLILEGAGQPIATPGGVYYDNGSDQFYMCKSDGWHLVTTS